MDVVVGQVWEDNDTRVAAGNRRRLMVVHISGDRVSVRRVDTNRLSVIHRRRFGQKLNGYDFISGPVTVESDPCLELVQAILQDASAYQWHEAARAAIEKAGK